MKRLRRSILSLVLCLAVALSMCVTFTAKADAAAITTVSSGSSITVKDINIDDSVAYQTPVISNTNPLKYTLKLPSSAGTVLVLVPNDFAYGVKVNGKTSSESFKYDEDGVPLNWRSYPVSANTATLEMTPSYSIKGNSIPFGVFYAPASRTISADGKDYILGASGDKAVSTLTVKATGKGYIEVTAFSGLDGDNPYSAEINGPGFKGWEYLGSSSGYTTRIGVKKGSYKISIRKNYSATRNVKVTFHPVKETSAKTSKAKAAKIKKKKVNKAVIVTNAKKAQKVRWYKIKNTKNQKMKLTYNATKLGAGSASGGKLKVTVYFPNKSKSTGYIYPGDKGNFTVKYGKLGTKKAAKGTYYVKVESVGGANGYYTMTWK